jgi:membrane associated rhomboid family serine protease
MQTPLTTLIIVIVTAIISFICFNDRSRFYQLAFIPYEIQRSKQWYRLITGGLVHGDYVHLIFNMLALYSFGANGLEQLFNRLLPLGNFGFLFFYVTALIVSHIPTYFKQRNNSAYVAIGASGAVSAVVFSRILLDPWSWMTFYFIPMPSIIFGIAYLGFSYYFMKRGGGGNVGHEVHYYGAIYGVVFMIITEPNVISYFINQLTHPKF